MSFFKRDKPKKPRTTCPATGEICDSYQLCKGLEMVQNSGIKPFTDGQIDAHPGLAAINEIYDDMFCARIISSSLDALIQEETQESFERIAAEIKLGELKVTWIVLHSGVLDFSPQQQQ